MGLFVGIFFFIFQETKSYTMRSQNFKHDRDCNASKSQISVIYK